jgi:hypothetical protein
MMRRHSSVLAVVVAFTALVGVLGPAAPGYATDRSSAPTWAACPPVPPATPRDPRQQCATLHVPLDYRNPHGQTINVLISRIVAAKPDQ